MNNTLENFYINTKSYYDRLENEKIDKYLKYIYHLTFKSTGKILDFGCGACQVIDYLNDHGYDAYGVDISAFAISKSKKTDIKKISLVDPVDYKIPFPENYFDSVGCFDVLEHCNDPSKILEEMVRVLKPGGRIVCTCPNFLRIIGISAHHRHTRGLIMKISNLATLIRKLLYIKFVPNKMSWDFMQPLLEQEFEPDNDAICMTNPIDIAYNLRNNNVKITYQSSLSAYNNNILLNIISELPLVRTVTGGCFIVGTKKEQFIVTKNMG